MDNKKNGFYTVQSTDSDDYRQKIRKHRLSIIKNVMMVIVTASLILAGTIMFFTLRHYEDFDIRETIERSDTAATHFEEFCGNILKYSNDGAFYTNAENELIWNQTYEMSDPRLDICRNYLTIYDKRGTMLYILTPTGLCGSIKTTMPIEQVSVAAQGTVAVLMEKDSDGYIALYDKEGNSLADGAIYGENSGYPITIALSHDAIKLAVSMLDFNDGTVKSTVAFYNYGSVGESVTDHCVGVSSYENVIIPEMKFVSSDRMVALADSEIMIFEGTQKPQLTTRIPMEQAKSIIYDSRHIGIVTEKEETNPANRLTVYDMKGSRILEQDFGPEYENIEFLSNGEICIRTEYSCDIYTTRGIYKFHYDFDNELYKVLPGIAGLNYTLILKGMTEKIRLK